MEFESLLSKNSLTKKRVEELLIEKGLDENLKGFKYLTDIITYALCSKKYSQTFMAEVIPFIAKRENIKEYSVQRQLRYTCTIKTKGKLYPNELAIEIWEKIKKERGEL